MGDINYAGINVNLNDGSGSGGGTLNADGGSITGIDTVSTSGSNYLQVTSTGINRAGSGNLPLILSPLGNGAIQVDSGGNSRGTYAVDLQSQRSTATQVASGTYSFAIGKDCTASGSYSAVFGTGTASGAHSVAFGGGTASGTGAFAVGGGADGNNSVSIGASATGQYAFAMGMGSAANGNYSTASGYYAEATAPYSTASGNYCVASKQGQSASSSANFLAAQPGTCQRTITHLQIPTASAAQAELTTDGGNPSGTTEPTSNRFIVPSTKSFAILLTVTGKQNGSNNVFMGVRMFTIVNISGTLTLSTVQTLGTDINPGGWATPLVVQADATHGSLQVMVAGAASTNIHWRATVTADELFY